MGKYLEALKLIYGDDEKSYEAPKAGTDKTDKRASVSNVSSCFGGFSGDFPDNNPDPVPFTDHEIAEHLIDTEVHPDDRSFVRQQLIGAYGEKRLARVSAYFEQFKISFLQSISGFPTSFTKRQSCMSISSSLTSSANCKSPAE